MLFIAYKTLDCLMLEEGVKRRGSAHLGCRFSENVS